MLIQIANVILASVSFNLQSVFSITDQTMFLRFVTAICIHRDCKVTKVPLGHKNQGRSYQHVKCNTFVPLKYRDV